MNWTIPNLLSIVRVIAAPCVALAFSAFDRPAADRIAVAIFICAALTDYLDGILARSMGQETSFGRMLDPVADKAMVLIALATIMSLYDLQWQVVAPAALIMLREVLVSGLREYLGAVKLSVTRLAKWKTTAQMFAIGLLFLSGAVLPAESDGRMLPAVATALSYLSMAFGAFGLLLLWVAAWFTLVTGWDYFHKGLAYIRRSDKARGEDAAGTVAEPEE
ncbi:MAG TPA: CDP-diacylglycerol--glycerol-3-phosphate 3-phosphatidyltransferase [Thermohalobaculum sp.]|nr:CDP-diacylglycerol--glycerol-3-phosphate 3-phosphatidyltransferase [Thermohalobaculum sp.]